MNEDITELGILCDMSGSMAHLRESVLSHYSSLIFEQQQEKGVAYLSTILFNSEIHVHNLGVPISQATPLNSQIFRPNGKTALLDSLMYTLEKVGERLAGIDERERPGRVLLVTITDGQDTCSRTPHAEVEKLIKHQKETYSWEFLFYGPSPEEGRRLGVEASNCFTYEASQRGTAQLYDGLSSRMSAYRRGGSVTFPGSGQSRMPGTKR